MAAPAGRDLLSLDAWLRRRQAKAVSSKRLARVVELMEGIAEKGLPA